MYMMVVLSVLWWMTITYIHYVIVVFNWGEIVGKFPLAMALKLAMGTVRFLGKEIEPFFWNKN